MVKLSWIRYFQDFLKNMNHVEISLRKLMFQNSLLSIFFHLIKIIYLTYWIRKNLNCLKYLIFLKKKFKKGPYRTYLPNSRLIIEKYKQNNYNCIKQYFKCERIVKQNSKMIFEKIYLGLDKKYKLLGLKLLKDNQQCKTVIKN